MELDGLSSNTVIIFRLYFFFQLTMDTIYLSLCCETWVILLSHGLSDITSAARSGHIFKVINRMYIWVSYSHTICTVLGSVIVPLVFNLISLFHGIIAIHLLQFFDV